VLTRESSCCNLKAASGATFQQTAQVSHNTIQVEGMALISRTNDFRAVKLGSSQKQRK